MDSPAAIIKALAALGLTEEQIAVRLKRYGVTVSQPTVNRIKRNKQRTSFEVGAALIRLRDELRDQRAR